MSTTQDHVEINLIKLPDIPTPTVTTANLKSANRKPGRAKRVVTEEEQCEWVYGRGGKKDLRCTKAKKDNEKYCGGHLKEKGSTQGGISSGDVLTDEQLCNWILKRGDMKNTRCTRPKNMKGDYCNEHKSRRSLSQNKGRKTCEWVCKRGKNKGNLCTTRATESSNLCSTHHKLQTNKLVSLNK